MSNPTSRRLTGSSRCAGLALACLLALPACHKQRSSAPSQAAHANSAQADAPRMAAAGTELDTPGPILTHTVNSGETLWDIARAYGLSTQDIMQQNGFGPNDLTRLRVGSQLKLLGAKRNQPVQKFERVAAKPLPALHDGAYHFLQRGESLWTLSRRYDVPLDAIMTRNHFSEDVHGQLQIGQAIIIPGLSPEQIEHADPAPNSVAAVRGEGLNHVIARGETVWDIARSYHVSVAEIMSANGLSSDAVVNVREGQNLFLPGIEEDGRGHVERKKTAREGRAQQVAARLGLGSLYAAGMLLHGRVEPRWAAAAGGGNTLGTLRWPVSQGWFVRGFGSGQGGYHKAMDIMGKTGWNVRAAAEGIVGYSGDKVPGFGNMIMLVHPGGWVTLYAHNSVNFVSAGEHVARGAVLAEVGSTGRSTGPHVHFELIYDGKNCDPASLFRPGVRHRNGKYSRVAYTTWRLPNQRPASIQCAPRQKHPKPVMSEDPLLDAQHVDDRDTSDLPPIDDLVSDLLR